MSACPADRPVSFRAATQGARALKEVFQTITLESCPKVYNFHMHTRCSDGKLSPEDLMSQAVDLGLRGMAITDHHSVKGYLKARRWMEDWRWRHPSAWQPLKRSAAHRAVKPLPRLWSGIEINARLLETEVHILGYAFDWTHPALQPYLQGCASHPQDRQAAKVIAAIQQAGGIAVLAHPARYRHAVLAELIETAARLGIDGVETYYAYDNPPVWRPSPEKTAQVKRLADRYQLLNTCGTDTHGLTLTRRL
ncbi:MAG: PHP domain-containing protein [Leptolyngbya sp. SIO4C1]|nr:PHP domain-containing protein [Leptolyngbya sp. SIO4C1]